uniref:Uncharacterized protein n=1 Tax=Romanomermis culicivorax TaxID=13658 RepID=A0A915KXJ1_ROMCU
HLLLRLDLSDEEVLNDIFHGFKQVVLAVRDVLKRDKTAFFHILEGLFHDKSSYFTKRSYRKHQIDILRSMNVFCVRIELDGKITQLNFMSVDHVAKYKQQRILNFALK